MSEQESQEIDNERDSSENDSIQRSGLNINDSTKLSEGGPFLQLNFAVDVVSNY